MLKRTIHCGNYTSTRRLSSTHAWWMSGIRLLMFSSFMSVISCYLRNKLAAYHRLVIDFRLRSSYPSLPLLSSKPLPNSSAIRPISLMIYSLRSTTSWSLNLKTLQSTLSTLNHILISLKLTTKPLFSRTHSFILDYHYLSLYR